MIDDPKESDKELAKEEEVSKEQPLDDVSQLDFKKLLGCGG